MQTLQTTSLRVADNQLFILDQQALPQEKRWLDASTVEALGIFTPCGCAARR
ncbi:translation initiation factor 2B subunit I [Enterobacter hormaechei]|nr:translation initiation factor 2B subunit I [Enterobacter hormaechei]